ncbi:MAG: iron-sulfur cluster assembly scaffold protein [Proteobacteria bacterium]|nr:iron-sulfur cluster assembly scaffold protein [Pseudomonadota bacterium]
MSDPLYRKEVLRLAADAHGAGRLTGPHRTGVAHNPTCGDKVSVDLALDAGGHIAALAHETKACVLSQASASILGRDLKGLTRAEVEKLRADVSAMLTGGSAPASPFDAYSAFDGVAEVKSRHRCVLLPIEAVLKAFES